MGNVVGGAYLFNPPDGSSGWSAAGAVKSSKAAKWRLISVGLGAAALGLPHVKATRKNKTQREEVIPWPCWERLPVGKRFLLKIVGPSDFQSLRRFC